MKALINKTKTYAGQSTLEYLIVLAMVIAIIITVTRTITKPAIVDSFSSIGNIIRNAANNF